MIDFTMKTFRSILASMLERVPDTFDKRDTSPIPTALSPAAYALEGFYLSLDRVQRMHIVQYAQGIELDYLAPLGSIERYPASAAVRLGVFNAAVPLGARFSTIDGEQSINFIVTATPDTAGQYELTAETPGTIGNGYTGPILPITTVPGLTSAQITDILIPGDDTETDEDLRARLIVALNDRPFAGNIAAYREFVGAIDGVGGVQVYPTWAGGGTVKLSVLGADLQPATEELVAIVQEAVDPIPVQGQGIGMAPIGATVTVVAPTVLTVDISATVTLARGYTLGQVQGLIETAVGDYLAAVRNDWDKPMGFANEYAADVYLARINSAIIGVPGIVNVTGITANGSDNDLHLPQTGETQQVPMLGGVTLYAA